MDFAEKFSWISENDLIYDCGIEVMNKFVKSSVIFVAAKFIVFRFLLKDINVESYLITAVVISVLMNVRVLRGSYFSKTFSDATI